ncbi:hypothetical protein [Nocardia suismassiliense]|uniref:hypothetical protein n=1 Tax=Nocardia suismassiliense TaxID=2077092 RepID=UPI00131F1DDF|nr:hypothetical protein [Nocardia suismassiliense]
MTTTALGAPGMVAAGTWTIDGVVPQPIVVNFVAEDGKWKVEKAWGCQLLIVFDMTSPMCR